MCTERHSCPQMESSIADDSTPINFDPVFREFSLPILDGGSSGMVIEFCPFCGAPLGPSLRDEWFDRLEELGLDPESPDVPAAMRSDQWWQAP